MSAPVSAVEVEWDVAVVDTRLARECVREFAVEANGDWRLLGVLFATAVVVVGGLASEFRRRRMPPTAYETGYVKNEDARWGVLGGGEDCGSSAVEDIAWVETVELQWNCSCKRIVGRVRSGRLAGGRAVGEL
jgi:hypothetical protein